MTLKIVLIDSQPELVIMSLRRGNVLDIKGAAHTLYNGSAEKSGIIK